MFTLDWLVKPSKENEQAFKWIASYQTTSIDVSANWCKLDLRKSIWQWSNSNWLLFEFECFWWKRPLRWKLNAFCVVNLIWPQSAMPWRLYNFNLHVNCRAADTFFIVHYLLFKNYLWWILFKTPIFPILKMLHSPLSYNWHHHQMDLSDFLLLFKCQHSLI